ncbi:MAG: envelope stress response membrane protein PspC [Gammaproteobacteria bacterium]
MTRGTASPTRLYKNRDEKVLCGVCSGIAEYFGFDVTLTRLLAVLSQFLFPATFLVYLGLCMLLPGKPERLYESDSDKEFWKGVRVSPTATLSDVRHRFRSAEAKLQRMERYVTSKNFNLDREFRDLERE